MNTTFGLHTLAASALACCLATKPCQAQVLDLASVEPLRPAVVITDRSRGFPDRALVRYGLVVPDRGYTIRAGEDPNIPYRRAHRFPEVTVERTEPFYPLSGPRGPGVKGVTAFRLVWPWPVPAGIGIPDSRKDVLWSWEPPSELRRTYPEWANDRGREAHAVLCLFEPSYPPGWKQDPVVFCFDANAGLRWRTPLPAASGPGGAFPSSASGEDPILHQGDTKRVLLGLTADGERILALVYPYPERRATWMYVLDGSGAILSSAVLPDRMAVESDIAGEIGSVRRAGTRFIVTFKHVLPEGAYGLPGRYPTELESYLVDRDGHFLRRFVDRSGRGVSVGIPCDEHVPATRAGDDGTFDHYIYRLP